MALPHQEDLLVEGDHPPVVHHQPHLVLKGLPSILRAAAHVDWESVIVKVGFLGKGEGEPNLALSAVAVTDLCISFLNIQSFIRCMTHLLHADTVAIQLTTGSVNHVVDDQLAQDGVVVARYLS